MISPFASAHRGFNFSYPQLNFVRGRGQVVSVFTTVGVPLPQLPKFIHSHHLGGKKTIQRTHRGTSYQVS